MEVEVWWRRRRKGGKDENGSVDRRIVEWMNGVGMREGVFGFMQAKTSLYCTSRNREEEEGTKLFLSNQSQHQIQTGFSFLFLLITDIYFYFDKIKI